MGETGPDPISADLTVVCAPVVVPDEATSTELESSQNPSDLDEAVTFTATVTGANGGTPTGNVTFSIDGVNQPNVALANGVATLTTSTLDAGTHEIVAAYAGDTGFEASQSDALDQVVEAPEPPDTPDSENLYLMAAKATKIAAQTSGQAMEGAVDTALEDAFGDGNTFSAGANGFYMSYAGGSLPTTAKPLDAAAFEERAKGEGEKAIASVLGTSGTHSADNLDPTVSTNWRIWADVRNTWWNSDLATGDVQGSQVNMLVGATYIFSPTLAAGVFGGYESFGYDSLPLNATLDGSGWTGGAYLGWKFAPNYRFDIGVAGTALDYDAESGAAQGGFDGSRLFLTTGVSGSHQMGAFKVSPSAKLYALWESDDAFNDTLGTAHAARSFSTARASGGIKVAYPFQSSSGLAFEPYVGAYMDYYFSSEDTPTLNGVLVDVIRDGWSARFTGGVSIVSESGLRATFGGEFGGLGKGGAPHGSIRARLSIPLD